MCLGLVSELEMDMRPGVVLDRVLVMVRERFSERKAAWQAVLLLVQEIWTVWCMECRAWEITGLECLERIGQRGDGEGYMRYDASQYERPQGEYQTIHENGKTFYELPETAKAPGGLPETRVSLEKDGTLKLEKIYREQRTVTGSQREQAETGNRMERPNAQNGIGKAGAGAGHEKSENGFGDRRQETKGKSVGKRSVKQRGKDQGAVGNVGQSGAWL